jgi:hypothetical protein
MATAGPSLTAQAAPGRRRFATWPRVAVEVRQVRGPNKPPPGSRPGQLLLGFRRKRVLLAAVSCPPPSTTATAPSEAAESRHNAAARPDVLGKGRDR